MFTRNWLTLFCVGMMAMGLSALALAQVPPTVAVVPYPGVGPAIDFVALFAKLQVAGGFVALAMRLMPHGFIQNQLVPKFLYVLFVLGNITLGLTDFGKQLGLVTTAVEPQHVVHLAGWGSLSFLALAKSMVLAVVQTYVGRRTWEEVGKQVLPPWVLALGKAPVTR